MAYNNLWSQYLGNEHPYFPALGAPGWVPESRPPAIRRSLKRVETAAAHGTREVGTQREMPWFDHVKPTWVWSHGMIPAGNDQDHPISVYGWGHICVIGAIYVL